MSRGFPVTRALGVKTKTEATAMFSRQPDDVLVAEADAIAHTFHGADELALKAAHEHLERNEALPDSVHTRLVIATIRHSDQLSASHTTKMPRHLSTSKNLAVEKQKIERAKHKARAYEILKKCRVGHSEFAFIRSVQTQGLYTQRQMEAIEKIAARYGL